MPYQPYQSTWNNPYMPANGPSSALGQSVIPAQQMQLANGWQQPMNGVEKVSGKDSLWQLPMPPNSTSKPYFDYNGKYFYIVTTDAAGAKTIETFDYGPHVDEQPVQIDGAQFVSRTEYDQFVAKVSAALEVINGVHAAVPATTVPATGTTNADEGADVTAPLHATGGHVGSGNQPSAI